MLFSEGRPVSGPWDGGSASKKQVYVNPNTSVALVWALMYILHPETRLFVT